MIGSATPMRGKSPTYRTRLKRKLGLRPKEKDATTASQRLAAHRGGRAIGSWVSLTQSWSITSARPLNPRIPIRQLSILGVKTSIRIGKPSILPVEPSILARKLSIFLCKLSILRCKPSILRCKLSILTCKVSILTCKPSIFRPKTLILALSVRTGSSSDRIN